MQTAVLTTLEIVLYVGGYMLLILTINPWLALLSLVPLPIWTWYILRFGKTRAAGRKARHGGGGQQRLVLTENIAGVHVIKAFATETAGDRQVRRQLRRVLRADVLKRIRLFADFTPVIRAIAIGVAPDAVLRRRRCW